jgi:hypothetical protein
VLFNIPLNLVDARMGMASRATAGTIRDCNSNGLDDGAELAYTDCNGNYVPMNAIWLQVPAAVDVRMKLETYDG